MEGVKACKLESKHNAKELRQAHFELGTDISTYEESQKVMKAGSPKRVFKMGPKPMNNNQVVNFSTEQTKTQDPQRFLSLNKQAA